MKEFHTALSMVLMSAAIACAGTLGCQRQDGGSTAAQPVTDPAPTSPPTEIETNPVIDGEILRARAGLMAKSVVQLLIADKKTGYVVTYCTASLIGRSAILSAGHCFTHPGSAFYVSFGPTTPKYVTPESKRVLRWETHPQYNTVPYSTTKSSKWIWQNGKYVSVESETPYGKSFDHDLTVAVFEGEASPDFLVATLDRDPSHDWSGQRVYLFGYGAAWDSGTTVTKKQFIHGSDLRSGLARMAIGFDVNSDHYFLDGKGPNFTCFGDSGGPEFVSDGKTAIIVGVNSTGAGGSKKLKDGSLSCKGASKAIRVAPFADWIDATVARLTQER